MNEEIFEISTVDFLSLKRINVRYFSEKSVVSFVPAFIEKHFGQMKVKPSQALVDIELDVDFNDIDLEEEIDNFGSIGYDFTTQIVQFDLPLEKIMTQLKLQFNEELIACIISLIQALKRSVSINVNCELQDFDISWIMGKENLVLNIFDTSEGGNGVSYNVYKIFVESSENKIIEEINSMLNKPCCSSFCSDCLLLPRTPENYIRFNYISKQALQKWLD